MMETVQIARSSGGRAYATFRCPGCEQEGGGKWHTIAVAGPSAWQWNDNPVRPTFASSVLVWSEGPEGFRCHSFITDGQIQYLPDSTHEMAGTTVPLPPHGLTP